MVCICMLMAYLLLWLRSKYQSLDLCQGVVVRGVIGRGFRFRFTRFIWCHKLCRYNNEQTTKQTKAINNSYIYIYHVNVTQTVPDIDAHASRPVACFLFLAILNIPPLKNFQHFVFSLKLSSLCLCCIMNVSYTNTARQGPLVANLFTQVTDISCVSDYPFSTPVVIPCVSK